MPLRRAGAAVLSAGIAATLLSLPPAGADERDDLRERREAVSDRIASAGEEVAESSKELAAATRVLDRVRAKLGDARARLAETRTEWASAVAYEQLTAERLANAEERLVKAESALVLGRLQVKQAEDRLADFVVSSSQYGDPSVVALDTILTGADPSLLSQNLALTDSIFGVQIASIEDLEAAKEALAVREDEVEAIRDEVRLQRREAMATVARKEELKARALGERREVAALVTQQAAARREAVAARRADVAQLRVLEREREQLSARLRRLAVAEAAAPSITVPSGSGATGVDGGASSAFMTAPVVAGITSPFGMRMHPVLQVYKLHDGTDFGVGCGTPVLAAADGDVVTAYMSEGYGNQLVVNHGNVNGEGLATSYSHLTSFSASPGDHVERGEIIGYSGNTGYSTGCHLHFMVYVNGAPVDPMGWL
jgi:murein DD-endopeptidase MepM/ murein hydrolase activator NlpD